MGYFFIDDDLRSANPALFKQARTAADSDSYAAGDIVETWDFVFRWDADCAPQSKMVEWRFQSDPLADAAIPTLRGPAGDAGGTDLLARLRAAATAPLASPKVTDLWHQIHSIEKTKFAWDRDQIKRGQAVFYRYAPHLLASLLHASLAGGFSSPRISRILNIVSYLTPPMNSTPEGEAPRISKASNERSFKRLIETTEFVIDCMADGAMEVGGRGWASAVRVRLLHTTMRLRILDKIRRGSLVGGNHVYDESVEGVPISQEDMAGTLTAFSAMPLVCLKRVGVAPSAQELEDYTALWRVIGYYLGIDQYILSNHFSNAHQSIRLLCSSIVNIFAGETDPPPPCQFPFETLVPKQDKVYLVNNPTPATEPDPYTSPATLPVLFCVCNRWPSPFDFDQHCAATRQLLGDSLCDWLSVPRSSWTANLQLWIGFAVLNVTPKFAQLYRKGWDEKYRQAMQNSVEDAVAEQLGNRHTLFRPRADGQWEPTKEGDEFVGSSLAWDFPTILGEWGYVYAEMVVVLLVVGLIAVCFSPLVIVGVLMMYSWKLVSRTIL